MAAFSAPAPAAMQAAQFNGGAPVPTAPAPTAPAPTAATNATTVQTSDLSAEVRSNIVIVGYIAPRKNTIKQVNLDTKAAKAAWDAAVKDGRINVSTQQSKSYNGKEVKLDPAKKGKFTPNLFLAFYSDVNQADYDRIVNLKAYRIDTSEARVDRYILQVVGKTNVQLNEEAKNCLQSAAEETGSRTAYNVDQEVAVFSTKQLVAFMKKTNTRILNIVAKNVSTANGKNPTIATLCFDSRQRTGKRKVKGSDKTNADGKPTLESYTYTEVFCLIVNSEGKRKTIRELYYGADESYNIEANKVAYAVLNDEGDIEGVKDAAGNAVAINADQILNKDRFITLFPDQKDIMTTLKPRKILKKKDIEAAHSADPSRPSYQELKNAQRIPYDQTGASQFGITDVMWETLAKQTASSSGGTTIDIATQQDNSAKVFELFPTGVKNGLTKNSTIKIR